MRSRSRTRSKPVETVAEPNGIPTSGGDLPAALERARRERAEAAEQDRAEATESPVDERPPAPEASEAMLSQLRRFEGELVDAGAKLEGIKRRIDLLPGDVRRDKSRGRLRRLARADSLQRDRLPDGAVLVATRLAREGRSRDEVRSFLEESFSGIDMSAVIRVAFRSQSA